MSSNDGVHEAAEMAAASVRTLDLAIERFRTAYAQTQRITVSDSLVMSHLTTAPDRRLTPTDLADRLRMSSGTLSTVVDRLEAAGFAHREPHPSDGRSVLVTLTPAGEESLRANRSTLLQAIRHSVPPSEQTAFAGWVEQIASHVAAAADRLTSD